jgi:flagellin
MRINHNIAALNTFRQLNSAASGASTSMERLSSGQRINKASDDAAGLAISEKMRGQIRGLEMAQKNSQDGISLLQTAEGALNETHSILQRMRELSVQAANDTNTASDREKLQGEVNALAKEVSRIGSTTEFNGKRILDGSFDGSFHIGSNQNQNLSVAVGDARSFNLGITGDIGVAVTGTYTAAGTTADALEAGSYSVIKNDAGTYEIQDQSGKVLASGDGLTFKMKLPDGNDGDDTIAFTQKVTSGSLKYDGTTIEATAAYSNGGLQAGDYKYDDVAKALVDQNGEFVASTVDGKTFTGEDGAALFTAAVPLSAGQKIEVGGADVTTQEAANKSITAINNALETVSAERSKMGSIQNRLQFTANSLSTTSENLTAAESRIRDVDMAKEMMTFTKNNILSQAAQAMLAQANQQPQGVLQLLR